LHRHGGKQRLGRAAPARARRGRRAQPLSRRFSPRTEMCPRRAHPAGAGVAMEPRLQRRIQRYGWDKAASFYEDSWQAQLEPAQTRLLEMAHLRPGDRVLDVACGTGLVSFRAAQAVGKHGSVLGTDISEGMIELARNRAPAPLNVRFERMDAEELVLENESVD